MKPTGIVRRIDDLGRVVLPKEVRNRYGLKENDPLEIYLTDEGIVLRRHSFGLIDQLDSLSEGIQSNCNVSQIQLGILQQHIQGIRSILEKDARQTGGAPVSIEKDALEVVDDIHQYLTNIANEYLNMEDERKLEAPNIQVYNHVCKELDDLSEYRKKLENLHKFFV